MKTFIRLLSGLMALVSIFCGVYYFYYCPNDMPMIARIILSFCMFLAFFAPALIVYKSSEDV